MATVAAFLMLLAACGGDAGPDAPELGSDRRGACNEIFCVDYPDGWDAEIGETFIALSHPLAPGSALASVGFVDMQGVVEANGGAWPASTETVVRDFWDLLGGGEDAELADVEVLADGTVQSDGELGGVRMWHRLLPQSGPRAWGVEVRAPNDSWQPHADVILGSVVPSSD